MAKSYTVSDGKLMLNLRPAGGGWYAVTSPLDPALITQARSVEEAFVMAYDAQKCLRAARAKLVRESTSASPGPKALAPTSGRSARLRRSNHQTAKAAKNAKS
jgi:antitoxin HicB